MDRVYLQWNAVNWITVVLMAAIGMVLIGFVMSGLRAYKLPAVSAEAQA